MTLARHAASAPVGIIALRCLELTHSTFPEPFRIVCDWQDWTVALETGESATFKAGQFRTSDPQLDDSGRIERPLRVDAVDRTLVKRIVALATTQERVVCTFRVYLSDDLSAPQKAPERTTLSSFGFQGSMLTATARSRDVTNRKFGRLLYTTANTPGLDR